MVRITESLVRKRAEHNECEISTLEEVSLHQQDIERIEFLGKWCRDLRILYLQNNLIPKIENVSTLKKLEYLNLAINNVEKIENLEGCESLKKLDLTLNFIGDLLSVEILKDLYSLEELYLTGNPCAQFEGYRPFVIATLPQLEKLDGIEITKSERITALQQIKSIRQSICQQQEEWKQKRVIEKEEAKERSAKMKEMLNDKNCDPSEYWKDTAPFTPESRVEAHEFLQEQRRREAGEDKNEKKEEKPKERKLFAADGRPYNVNEAGIDFKLVDREESNCLELDVAIYKYMDTSLLSCDVQVGYVRVTLRNKILQLALPEPVKPDSSKAVRSEITGHLVITMPKEKEIPQKLAQKTASLRESGNKKAQGDESRNPLLEIPDESGMKKYRSPLWQTIVQDNEEAARVAEQNAKMHKKMRSVNVKERENSADFVDDPDVPPLI